MTLDWLPITTKLKDPRASIIINLKKCTLAYDRNVKSIFYPIRHYSTTIESTRLRATVTRSLRIELGDEML